MTINDRVASGPSVSLHHSTWMQPTILCITIAKKQVLTTMCRKNAVRLRSALTENWMINCVLNKFKLMRHIAIAALFQLQQFSGIYNILQPFLKVKFKH